MRLSLSIALGIALGVALIPVAWRVVRGVERGVASVHWGWVAATIAVGLAIAVVGYVSWASVRNHRIRILEAELEADTTCTERDHGPICSGDEWERARRRRDSVSAAIAALVR